MITGKRIKSGRKELGLSAEAVAKKLGVSPATIYRYENGDIENPPIRLLEQLCGILKVTPIWLMGWDGYTNLINVDMELREYVEELNSREEMRELFYFAKNLTKEDIGKNIKIMKVLKN